MTPKRIAIIGSPGSGKSTLALKLGKQYGLPVYHLDAYAFENEAKTDKEQFLQHLQKILTQDEWIIEGCSFSTFEMRFAKADTVIYLKIPRLHCLWRACKRALFFDEALTESGCLRSVNFTLLRYIWNFEKDKHQKILDLKKRYPHAKYYILTSSDENLTSSFTTH